MSFISPEEIAAKAEKAYPRFLKAWIRGDDGAFFPLRVRGRLTPNVKNPKTTIAANERLLGGSKQQLGWGYTVHREQVRSRDFGCNVFPKSISIDTPDDLLRLAKKKEDFEATRDVAQQVRRHLPQLEAWLSSHVRSLSGTANAIDGLIRVTQFFLDNPWPDCYARQIPVSVDTKFVQRNQATLRQWLDQLLPDSAIDINESKFARRFGLRDGDPHRGLRLLDSELAAEMRLPYDELSLPLRSIAALPVRDVTVFIVENDLNLLTLPPSKRGIGIRGEGNAVNRLERLTWLNNNRVIYWGDIDVEGLIILSRLRNLFSHVESVLMDLETIDPHQEFVVPGNGAQPTAPTNLTQAEAETFNYCRDANIRLEQEKLLQSYVDSYLGRAIHRGEQT